MDALIEILKDSFKSSIFIGLIYGIGTVGLGFIYKYLKFPDFTTMASIAIGSITMVVVGEKYGIAIGLISSLLIGSALGLFTALQITIVSIPPILAGICTSVGAYSVSYSINSNNADASFSRALRPTLDLIVNNVYTTQSLITLTLICIIISLVLSLVFSTKFGLYILAMMGTENYLNFHHKKKGVATVLIIVVGNGVIGFAGALAAIQNGTATVRGHEEFLLTALGGYVLGMFFIVRFTKKSIRSYLGKDNTPSGNIVLKLLYSIQKEFSRNDEDRIKIFYTFLAFIFSTALINLIFQMVEIGVELPANLKYMWKAILVFLILAFSIWTEKLSETKTI